MEVIHRWVGLGNTVASSAQVLLYLPLALDIGGKPALLGLSLLLCMYFFTTSTIHLIARNTPLYPLSLLLTLFQPFAIPSILILALNIYSSDKQKLASHTREMWDWTWWFAQHAPGWWEFLLRTASPVFVILEGISTLMCIQAIGKWSKKQIRESSSPDFGSLLALIFSSSVYVASAWFLHKEYDKVTNVVSATLIGVTITSILFLTGIAFAIQKGNVVETCLVMAYAVFQFSHLSTANPELYSPSAWHHFLRTPGDNGHPPLPPAFIESIDAVTSFASTIFGHSADFLTSAFIAIPVPVFIGFFYRVTVLYFAARVVLALKRRSEGYDPSRRLSDEDASTFFMTLIPTYTRSLIIAVYTHLLLLSSSGEENFWKWMNIFLTLALWGFELGAEGGNEGDYAGWKDD